MMSRIFRPYIPLRIRCEVATRQLGWNEPYTLVKVHHCGYGALLEMMLHPLAVQLGCNVSELRLDHEPALALRPLMHKRKTGTVVYKPDANDPEFLFYRPHGAQHAGSHDIKTRIRGDHGQFSDIALIKRQRRRERGPKPKRGPKIVSRGFPKIKRPFPKRSFK